MYNNPYNQQNNIDRINAINNEIANLEMRRTQAMMPQPITQNFQMLNNNSMRYANDIEEVKRDYTINDTPFFSKDMSVLWVKNIKGDIKTYELKEIVQKDEKDMLIEMLQAQINEMKGMIQNAKSNDEFTDEPTTSKKSSNVQYDRPSKKK